MILLKLLKKLIRRLSGHRRRWVLLVFWAMLAAASFSSLSKFGGQDLHLNNEHSNPSMNESRMVFNIQGTTEAQPSQSEVLQEIMAETFEGPAVMITHYVCGEESIQLGYLNHQSILEKHREYPEAEIHIADEGTIVFKQWVQDLSPQCKNNAYFGVDALGNLTLFEGPPDDNQVIRTFFQLNVKYLESKLESIQQLVQGIRITDLTEYFSVLSTFSDYAVDETEAVLAQRFGLNEIE